MNDFAGRLLAWHDRQGRKDLPWQRQDAYRTWISEIMLQQTQVKTVIPYYERFLERFPDVVALADAPVDEVLHHWSGLGYYARARNLHRAAAVVRDEHGGNFPADFDTVAALPGIGRSTAGAILALAFGQRHAILDGNAKRVLARHEAIAGWPGRAAVQKKLWAVAERHTPATRAADYTQAIMDLGALLCTRTRPACALCPVAEDCSGLAVGNPGAYPGKKPKRDKPRRETTMLLALSVDAVYLERRPPAGIWGGLWSFPEVDGQGVESFCEKVTGERPASIEAWEPLRHGFTHFDLDIHPVVARVPGEGRLAADDDAVWYRLDDTPPGGIAAPVRTLIDNLRNAQHVANG